ncbi:MAG: methyltransferase domain-containing protein [Pseudomonadales bacterium]|nr:methyltransferase domain-containing protein [Pseudomonadales bacterium]
MASVRIRYQTLEFGSTDIHLRTLRNKQQFCDTDNVAEGHGVSPASWPLFGVLWPSSQVLAHLMYEKNIEGLRILEVGCGLGLASHVLNHRLADITATDYNPEAGSFMKENSRLNNCKPIPFSRAGWSDDKTNLGKFDLVIGSDLLYEPDHVDQLSSFIDAHAKDTCEVIIVDPGRSLQAKFSNKMLSLGYRFNKSKPENTRFLEESFKGNILVYAR